VNAATETIDLWVVEDNEGFRNAVCRALNLGGGIHCSASFGSCEQALMRIASGELPRALLLDIDLPGISGVEGVRRIKERAPSVLVIMLTIFDDYSSIFQALCGGANGYILKTASLEAIAQAIREVVDGGAPMSPPIARSVLSLFTKLSPPQTADYGLTSREKQALGLLVEGLSKKELAARLDLSVHTVDKHIRSIYDKLHVHSRSAVVAKAIKERLF
jgi:DNA-binding NarL/FixJ family response regulator